MKLVKLFNKLSAVALAASLVVGFASCSTTTDDPFNANAPLTLEEYVKAEIKKTIDEGGASVTPQKPSTTEPGLEADGTLTFHVTADALTSADTKLFMKYDRTAAGKDEAVIISGEIKISVNGVVTNTVNSVTFPLDDYGTSFSGATGQIQDENDRKEYKAKLDVKNQVKTGDVVTVYVKAKITHSGKDAAAANVDWTKIMFALIDTSESAGYYNELAAKEEEYVPVVTVEDPAPDEDPVPDPAPDEDPKPTPVEDPEPVPVPDEESARPAIGDVVYSASGDSLTVVLPQNIYGDPAVSHGIQVTKAGILPKGAKAGETYKIVLKGTASGAFSANVQFLDKGWQGLGDEATVADFTTEDFNITAYYTFGFDTEDGYMFVIGNDDAECTEKTLTLTEFSITRENKPAGGEEGGDSVVFDDAISSVVLSPNNWNGKDNGIQYHVANASLFPAGIEAGDKYKFEMTGSVTDGPITQKFIIVIDNGDSYNPNKVQNYFVNDPSVSGKSAEKCLSDGITVTMTFDAAIESSNVVLWIYTEGPGTDYDAGTTASKTATIDFSSFKITKVE